MRSDIITAIKGSKNVTHAVLLTHNIDFVFLETVVLSALRKCGQPTITVFTDARCAAESYRDQGPFLDRLGTRYRVVPVAMKPGLRFHPKAILLSGEEAGSLFIGSGNLTFGGWRENAEAWVRMDSEVEGSAPFAAFRSYMGRLLARVPLAEPVIAEIGEALNGNTRPWCAVTDAPTSDAVLGQAGDDEPLVDRIARAAAGGGQLDELVVCAPYFDDEGVALRTLIEKLAPKRTTVLCQPEGSTLTQRALDACKGRAQAVHVSFEHVSDGGQKREAFIHAKFYAVVRGPQTTVVVGSANCSRAALMTSAQGSNAELLVVRNMPTDEFEPQFLGELQRISLPLVLPDKLPVDAEAEVLDASLRILAARYDAGILRVAFAPERTRIQSSEVDGVALPFAATVPGIISISPAREPRSVRLVGAIDDAPPVAAVGWVDYERFLRTTSHERGLADAARTGMQPGAWTPSAWSEIMEVFCKHLVYTPGRDSGQGSRRSAPADGANLTHFSFADVFASDYRSPTGAVNRLTVKFEDGRERSLQQLFLRWFGLDAESKEDAPVQPHDEDGEDGVDQPERIVSRSPVPDRPPPTKSDRRRIKSVLRKMEQAMASEQFLATRHPELIAADIKIAAVLLRAGLAEKWIEPSEFFGTTHHVWTAMFFSGSPDADMGWIEYRLKTADDPVAFVNAIRSPELAAALLGWMFAVTPDVSSPEASRFQLATALAVARLPWLWDGGDQDAVVRELQQLLANTTGGNLSATVATIPARWDENLRRGHALLRLEEAIRAVPLEELRARIRRTDLRSGELLWQGSAGYCVAAQDSRRIAGHTVAVLKLRSKDDKTKVEASFTVPLLGLLDDGVLPPSVALDKPRQRAIEEFTAYIAKGFSRPKLVRD